MSSTSQYQPDQPLQTSQVDFAREELNAKCCFIRMQYHPCFRVSFEVVWRLLFIMDLFFDIALCLQYTTFSTIWWLFVSVFCIPYILSSIVLFLPFHRRITDREKAMSRSIIYDITIVILYSICCLPCIVLFDLYICTRLIITDLSTTRYFLYYWRLKTLVELTFEAIPQTILLICIGLGLLDTSNEEASNINVQMLYGSLSMSILCLIWYCMVIYSGAQSTGLSIYDYLFKYYIMQGMDMIPYQEAITQNLLSDFILTSENLTLSEWTQLIKDLFRNFSIVQFDISGQQHLHFSSWLNLFESLANNNLTTLKLKSCFIFHLDNIHLMQKRHSLPLDPKNQYESNDRNSSLNLLRAGLSALILNVPSLVIIDIGNNYLSNVFRGLIKPISKLKKLKELYLEKNSLNETELIENEYTMLFRGCVSLIILDLSSNDLNDTDINIICNAIQKCKDKKKLQSLEKINLNQNQITRYGANKLLKTIQQNNIKKLSITLQQNNIKDHVFEDMQSKSAISIIIDD